MHIVVSTSFGTQMTYLANLKVQNIFKAVTENIYVQINSSAHVIIELFLQSLSGNLLSEINSEKATSDSNNFDWIIQPDLPRSCSSTKFSQH